MKVSAVIVTRGDVDLGPCLAPILAAGVDEIIVRRGHNGVWERYEGAAIATGDVIYTQDDDCTVDVAQVVAAYQPGLVACNMPAWKRYEYPDQIALVGWGAAFDSQALNVFEWYRRAWALDDILFRREADRVFTGLNALKLIDVPFAHLPWADGPCRMAAEREHGSSLIEIRQRIAAVRRH